MSKRILGILVVISLMFAILVSASVIQDIKSTSIKIREIQEGEIVLNEAAAEAVQEMVESIIETVATEPVILNAVMEEENQNTEPVEPTEAEEVKPEFFSPDITFSSEYISGDDVMPYALYTPSTADDETEKALIVWLHGQGEVGVGQQTFLNSGLPKTLNNWKFEGFNAYIICPQLKGAWATGRWSAEATKNNLQALLDKFISEHNIDEENVIIVGHSLGGQGALYMAHQLSDYFSRCVVLSGYWSGIENSEIDIPTVGYVGTNYAGEDQTSINYMESDFVPAFGREKLFYVNATHGLVPNVVFNLDDNGNNRSDVVEWMFGELELINSEN